MTTVAYTGRESLKACRVALLSAGARFVPDDRDYDLGVSAGGRHIFTREEIAQARCGIVNLHMAPLPQYRGRYSAGHALRNGETTFGATLHYVDEGIDTGPIIGIRLFDIKGWETVDSLREKARIAALVLFEEWAPRLVEAARSGHRVASWAQDEHKAHYYDRHSLP